MIQQKDNSRLKNWEIVSVNPNDKNWNWKDLFCFWGSGIQSLIGFSLIASLYLVYQLNVFVVFFGCLLGSILIYFFSNLIGKPSQKHGVPFPVLLRLSMGIYGARYIALLRGLVGIFMFGIQTYFLSKSFGYLIRICLFSIDSSILNNEFFLVFILGLNFIDWLSLILSLWIQYLLFSNGQNAIKSVINFSANFVYFGLVVFLIIMISENFSEIQDASINLFRTEHVFSNDDIFALVTVAGTFFAFFSILLVNYGDFSRYVKDEKELKKGNFSLFLNLIIFSFLSVLIALGADIIFDKKLIAVERILTNPTDIIGKFDNTFLTFIALLFILVASASTNLIANYVCSQNSLINFYPNKLTLKSSGFLIILFGLLFAIFWETILSQIGIISLVDTIGSFFGPIAGIVITDYYLIKNQNLINKDIFSTSTEGAYYFSGGWHLKGIYSLLIGFIFAASTIWNYELRFLQPFSWIIGAFFSSLTYYLLVSK